MIQQEKYADIHLFALEHRYYGDSYPKFEESSPLSNENLKYLSSKQALSDVGQFILHIQADAKDSSIQLPNKTKWVTFGSSYAGFLAGYARVWFPHLVHAAVSSSAPMLGAGGQVNFAAYKERQALDLQYERIGGSSKCLKVVLDGHAEIAWSLRNKEYSMLSDLFNICDGQEALKDAKNVGLWLGDGVVDVPSEYNDPSCHSHGGSSEFLDACNVDAVCDILLQSAQDSTALEALAVLADIQNDSKDHHGKDTCTKLDWKHTLKSLKEPKDEDDNSSEDDVSPQNHWERSYHYQMCTEFGMFQTCEANSLCPFGQGYRNVDADFEICESAFGLSKQAVDRGVKTTADHYGDITKHGSSRILSVNGDVDPWNMLALKSDNDEIHMPVYTVQGASHHFWTHPVSSKTDNQEIRDAREIIHMKVMQWLEEEDHHGKQQGAKQKKTDMHKEKAQQAAKQKATTA